MAAVRAHIASHPVLAYYTLAFAISWAAMLAVIGGAGAILPASDQVERLMPLVVLALIAGPTVACLVLTALESGRAGPRRVAAGLVRWRVPVRWYAVALLTAPVSTAALLFALSLHSPEFLPRPVTADGRGSLLLLAVGTVPFGGLFEEVGWTGFAIPRLRRRHSVLSTGLIAGVLWGAWHFPVNLWYSGGAAGGLSLSLFVPLYLIGGVAQLTATGCSWCGDRTESLLVATLMHGSLIASTAMPILVPSTTGAAFLTWFLASAATMWSLVAVVAVATRGLPSRPAAPPASPART